MTYDCIIIRTVVTSYTSWWWQGYIYHSLILRWQQKIIFTANVSHSTVTLGNYEPLVYSLHMNGWFNSIISYISVMCRLGEACSHIAALLSCMVYKSSRSEKESRQGFFYFSKMHLAPPFLSPMIMTPIYACSDPAPNLSNFGQHQNKESCTN